MAPWHMTCKSHNCASYMQNRMYGNPNTNLPSTCANVPVRHMHLEKKLEYVYIHAYVYVCVWCTKYEICIFKIYV